MKTWTAKMGTHDISVTSKQLDEFRRLYVSDSDLLSRMSELLWFDIYVLDCEFGISPHDILKSVENLESGEPHSGIKPATPFKNPPLKGLWHKHYFSAPFLVKNISLGLGKNGLTKLVDEIMDPKKSDVITPEMIDELAHRMVHEPVENRDAQGKMTGEWLIFAKYNGKNYYLCLNTHDAGDQLIFDRIHDHCLKEFPDLPNWMKSAP
jgi:hypothetical protein